MSEELSYEIYKWLSSISVLPTNLRYKSNGNYELDTKTADNLKSGFLISKLLVYLAKQHGAAINQPLIFSIKQSNTPAAKVYNWNILTESFTKLNVTIGKQTQKQITAGNFNTLIRFLLDLHKRFNPRKQQKKEESGDIEINLKKLQVLQNYDEAENFIEMAIMIIGHSLNLTPKQVLSTFSQNCKYYAHMVVKGIKNSFIEIMTMLDTFITHIPKLMFFCEKNPQKHTQFFLDLIKPTLISRDSQIVKNGCKLFELMIQQSLKYNSKNLVYQILCKQNVGFDFLYMGLKRHPDLVNQFTSFLFPLIKDAFSDFFQIHLKRTINNEQEYLKIVLRIIEGLTANTESKTVLKQSGLLNVWLKNSELSFEKKKNKEQNPVNEQTKILYLQLLCNLWKYYASEVDQQYAEQLLIKGIQQLKRNTRKDIYTIKVPALLRLFDFLHFLADNKNKVAPILYKKLIFLLIENHEEEQIRELILSNFKVMLKKYPTIPVQFLVEPLLRQLINTQGQSYILNIFDFQFLIQLCKHPRMDAENALSYLQFLSKLYIKSVIYAKLIIRVIEVLTSRFCEEQAIIQFIKKNIDSTLNLYGILTFNKKKLSKQDTIINKQKKSLAIQLIKHFTLLQHQDLSKFIQQKIIGLYLLWAQTKKHLNKGLKYLIQLYGDVDELCLQYKVHQNQREQISLPITSQATIRQTNVSRPTRTQTYQEIQYMKQKGIGYKMNKKANTQELIDRNVIKASPSALQQLEKIKQKIKGDANKKKEMEDIELKKIKERTSANNLELLQRNLSLGYAKLVPQSQEQILFDFGTVKPKQLKLSYHFHTLDQLQQIDKESAKVILKLYAKDIKSIFSKYALISSTHQNNRKEQNVSVMSFTEVVKMLNQKGMSDINKFIVSDIISSINYNKRKERNILFGIQQPEFNDFLIKITDFIIQNQKNSLQVPFGLKMQKVIKNLLYGQVFYENRFRIKEDIKITKLRQALKNEENFQSEIPQGYKKIKENRVELKYQPADQDWGVKQRFLLGYELADWLISRCLDLHIMTPCVQIKERYDLIQIPKIIKPKNIKQELYQKIKQDDIKIEENEFLNNPKINTPNNRRKEKSQRRSQSQRAIHKPKVDLAAILEQQKIKAIKRQKYAQQLKQNLAKMRQQKALKQQQKKKQQAEQRQKQRKKQQERKQYLNNNKLKIDEYKKKEAEQKIKKEEQERRQKEIAQQERKKRQKQLFEKHQEDIKKRADVMSQKRRELQNSRDRKAKQFQKLAKQNIAVKEDVQQQKLKMLQIKNSLEKGELKNIVSEHQREFRQLYTSYYNWEKNKIELNAIALLLRDFQISPEFILPKTISDIYKSTGKGQPLDFDTFMQCLTKCAYNSSKFQEDQSTQSEVINPIIFKKLITKLKMDQENYKQVVKIVKNHLE